jgi:hypothetical protein
VHDFKANFHYVSLLTQEPLVIVRSKTKNYKTWTKSSVLRLFMTLDTRKFLNLHIQVLDTHFHAN